MLLDRRWIINRQQVRDRIKNTFIDFDDITNCDINNLVHNRILPLTLWPNISSSKRLNRYETTKTRP